MFNTYAEALSAIKQYNVHDVIMMEIAYEMQAVKGDDKIDFEAVCELAFNTYMRFEDLGLAKACNASCEYAINHRGEELPESLDVDDIDW